VTLVLFALGALLAGGALCLALGRAGRFGLGVALVAVILASVAGTAGALGVLLRGEAAASVTLSWPLPLGSADLALDGLSAWFLLTLCLLAAPVAVYSWRHLEHEPAPGGALYGSLLCLLVAALVLVFVADDVVLFLVAWEGMTLCAFFLVGFHHRGAEVRRGAWIYVVATHAGTALALVPMFAVLVARTGSSRLSGLAAAAGAHVGHGAVFLLALGLVGFGTKAGIWPLHVWLPHAHPAAPTPVSALLSGVVIKSGIYGLLRLLTWLPPLGTACGVLLLSLGAVTGLLGVLLALTQHDVKRLLAYHSVENIGIMLLGIGLGVLGQATAQPALVALGLGGALLHVLNHALFKGLLFLSAGAVIHATGTGEIDRLGGLAKRSPVNAAMFLLGAVAICGLPPGNGFVSEWLLYGGLFGGATTLPATSAAACVLALAALALMGGLALACFAKVYGVVFLGEPRDASLPARATPGSMLAAMALPAGACLLIGLLPALCAPLTAEAVRVVARVPVALDASSSSVLGALPALSALGGVLVGAVVVLALVRRAALARHGIASADVPTWGCGYARSTPRMATTGSSFAWALVSIFRGALWPRRDVVRARGPFAREGRLETHAVDVAELDLFAPLLRAARRVAHVVQTASWSGRALPSSPPASIDEDEAREHPRGPFAALRDSLLAAVRRGTVHVHVALIVLTLLALFVVEALSRSGGAR
jgi:formate hydrogenlyase subunit 3/multisubunit Na+/H+ antiporter MnhD subunit